jgi:hypothetical protein
LYGDHNAEGAFYKLVKEEGLTHYFDQDGDGTISFKDLIAVADKNKDGFIQKDEFLASWKDALKKDAQMHEVVEEVHHHAPLHHVEAPKPSEVLSPVQEQPQPPSTEQPPPLPKLNLDKRLVPPAGPSKADLALEALKTAADEQEKRLEARCSLFCVRH